MEKKVIEEKKEVMMEGKGWEIERRSRKCREFGVEKGEVKEK